MTTLQLIELRCPICDTRFKSQQVISTNSFGGKRTDFHERAAGTQPLPFLIHMCNRCGYSGAERDFTDAAEVSAGLREHVWNELAPQLSTAAVSGSEKYEAAAKVAEWQAMDARYIADQQQRDQRNCLGDTGLCAASRKKRRLKGRSFLPTHSPDRLFIAFRTTGLRRHPARARCNRRS